MTDKEQREYFTFVLDKIEHVYTQLAFYLGLHLLAIIIGVSIFYYEYEVKEKTPPPEKVSNIAFIDRLQLITDLQGRQRVSFQFRDTTGAIFTGVCHKPTIVKN